MPQHARIKVTSINLSKLNGVCEKILQIGKNTGVRIKGPIPLPVKRLRVATRKSPCGNGTETYEKWEMRMHRRIFVINVDEKAMKQLTRIDPPNDVYVELNIT